MKKLGLLALTAVLLGVLSGCSQPETTQETVYTPQIAAITETTEKEGKQLIIDASVEIPDLSKLETITLKFDETRFQAAGADLVLSQYPYLKEGRSPDGYRGWSEETAEQLLIAFDCQDEGFRAGWCYYVDVLRDLNGQAMPGDDVGAFNRYYMTENIPNKLGMTSREAAEKIAGELAAYSCFTYEPWSVTAYNIRENPAASGYYSALMQPCFEGWPVYGKGALMVSSHLSAEGLFSFQGVMVLKETGRMSISCGMDLDSAVARFQEDFAQEANEGAQVFVERITPAYKAVSEYDGTWTLSPVWSFECREVRGDREYFYNTVYKMENGAISILE